MYIWEAEFNFFETKGFQAQPKLALLAGAAIGYKLALSDYSEHIKEISNGR